MATFAQQKIITGKAVLSDENILLPDVAILEKGITSGNFIHSDVTFTIAAKSEDVLIISFVVYVSQEIKKAGIFLLIYNSLKICINYNMTQTPLISVE